MTTESESKTRNIDGIERFHEPTSPEYDPVMEPDKLGDWIFRDEARAAALLDVEDAEQKAVTWIQQHVSHTHAQAFAREVGARWSIAAQPGGG